MNELPLRFIAFNTSSGVKYIPSDKMMEEALNLPELNKDFALRILRKFDYPIIEKVSELNRVMKQSDSSLWDDLTKELGMAIEPDPAVSKYNPKLYAYFSLQQYRLVQPNDFDFNLILRQSSDPIFIGWSNRIIERMINHPEYQNSKLHEYNSSYDDISYSNHLIEYCESVFPHPLKHQQSINSDYQNRASRGGLYDKQQAELFLRMGMCFSELDEAVNRAGEWAKKHKYNLKNCRTVRRRDKKNTVTEVNRIVRKGEGIKSKDIEVELLCRCWFCGKYRIENRLTDKGKPNTIARYCSNPSCKHLHDAWRKNISNHGIKIADIEKLGF
jgi:hypothetical protein